MKKILIILVMVSALISPKPSFAFGGDPSESRGYCRVPPRTPTDTTQPFQVTPATLLQRVTASSIDVLTSLNAVDKSKAEVDDARAKLFPSINLNTALQFAGPNFILAAVDFLLPFLVPDNWFALHASEYQLDSDKESYLITELNDFASAYSLYMTILNDQELEQVLQSNVDDWKTISQITDQKESIGMAVPGASDLAHAQMAMAQDNLVKTHSLNIGHMASLRAALALPPDQSIQVLAADVSPSSYENVGLSQAVDAAYALAPEVTQIQDLLNAAQAGELSADFGFISSSTLAPLPASNGSSGSRPAMPNLAFKNFEINQGFSIGPDIFPQIELSRNSVDALLLRQREIRQELTATLETALGQIPDAVKRFQFAQQAETSLEKNYRIVMQRYQIGVASLLDVIQARTGIVDSSTERLAALTDLALQRINLHRIFRTDQFARVEGCDYREVPPN